MCRKIIAISLILVSFLACETVEEPFIESNPLTGEYASDAPIRKILVEDYTGFACPNCPRAAEEIENMIDRYGKHIVPVEVHSGWFATPAGSDDPDYRTDVGLVLGGNGVDNLGFFNVTSQPIGIINRKQINGEYKVEYESWSTEVVNILSENKFADINIEISSQYNSSDRVVNLDFELTAIKDVHANISLTVYITESHVVGKQSDGSTVIEDYEHNHILRKGVNGTWGEDLLTSGVFAEGEILQSSYTDTLSASWVAANCDIIAFAYNKNTKEVVQVEVAPVIAE